MVVYLTVKKYAKVLGNGEESWKNVMRYGFRRSVVINLLEKGVPTAAVEKFMRWKS